MNNITQELTNKLIASLELERTGELSKNGARLNKGECLTLLEREGMRLKAAGEELDSSPLQFAVTQAKNAIESKGVFDTRLDNDEVSVVRKAFTRVAEPLGGADATFQDVYARNPHTGEKLVNDAGQPFTRPISEVAVNKLYLIADYAEHDFDAAISFAKRASEKGIKKLNRVWKRTKDPNTMFSMMMDLAEMYGTEDQTISLRVNEELGIEDEGPEYKNIQVPAHLFDGAYSRCRRMMSLILGFNGNEEALEKESGMVMPGIMLETILVTLLDPQEYGPWNMLEVLVRAGTVNTEQAANFKLAWDEDGLAERWEESPF